MSACQPSLTLLKSLPPVVNVTSLDDVPFLSEETLSAPELLTPPAGFIWLPPAPTPTTAAVGGYKSTIKSGATTTAAPKNFAGGTGGRSFVPMSFASGGNSRVTTATASAAGLSPGNNNNNTNNSSSNGATSPSSSTGGSMFKRPTTTTTTTTPSAILPPPPPPPTNELPDGWVSAKDESGSTYYYNSVSGESTWEIPVRQTPSVTLDAQAVATTGATDGACNDFEATAFSPDMCKRCRKKKAKHESVA